MAASKTDSYRDIECIYALQKLDPERERDHAVVLVNRTSFPDADGWELGQN